jgi:hypothetical protein
MNRRTMLKTAALAGVAVALPLRAASASRHQSLLNYLESLARPDGGYGFAGQERSHLTASFAVAGCYRLLRRMPPNRVQLAEFIRTHHPRELKKLEQERRVFEFQQIQALSWLEYDVSEFRDAIRQWTQPLAYLRQYEQSGYPIFQSEMGAVFCRALLKLPLADLSPHFTDYLNSRRRANGTYNNTPAGDGSDGHVMNTWWGLQAARLLGKTPVDKDATIAWLRACQRPSGGFTFQPKPEFGGVDDVAYTRAAVRGLQQLGGELPGESCVRWIHLLRAADGGFSDRLGWQTNPLATYCALDALDSLGAIDTLPAEQKSPPRPRTRLSGELKVFSIQIEAHGQGSPAEAVDLARALRIHLWGAKNARPGWIARAQAIARRGNAPVQFFASNEEYGTWVNIPGMGTYSHTSDIIAPADSTFGAPMGQRGPGAASAAVSWPEFRRGRLAPLEHAKGRLIWQFGENEELVRMFLDDSVERGGYAAISTYHFGNPDFTNSEPFLHRWRGQIPFVALQDAHGAEPWWFADMTAGFRTLFIAQEPTWDAWLDALKEQRVVAVRRDALSRGQTWMHGSSRETVEFVREREEQWRWWSNPAIARPLVSIVALTPEDEFEVARPERGITLRVRCARANTAQGLPREPLAEFVRLVVDGAEVQPELVSTRAPRGNAIADYYHRYHLAPPVAGVHRAAVTVRSLEAKTELTRTIEFRV